MRRGRLTFQTLPVGPALPPPTAPPPPTPPLYESPCRCCLKPDSLTLLYGHLFVSAAAAPEGKILQVLCAKTTKEKKEKKKVSLSEQKRRRRSVSVAPRLARFTGRGRGSSRPLISEDAFGIFTQTPHVLSRLAAALFGLQRRSLNSLPNLISISRRLALKRQTPSKPGLGDAARLPVIPIKLRAFPVINGEELVERRSPGDRNGSHPTDPDPRIAPSSICLSHHRRSHTRQLERSSAKCAA